MSWWKPTLALLTLVLPFNASAQVEGAAHAAVVVGLASYDLSGTGSTVIYGVRIGAPIRPRLGGELALSYLNPGEGDEAHHFIIPELQLQLEGAWRALRPYVGLGAGVSIDVPEDREILPGIERDTRYEFAPSGSLGTRIQVSEAVSVQIEGRLHGIEATFTGSVAELVGGIGFSF